jgi:hypothetical protein
MVFGEGGANTKTIYKEKNKLFKYTVYVTHEGKTYQTNVIADKNQTEEEVYNIAKEQVSKQWTN